MSGLSKSVVFLGYLSLFLSVDCLLDVGGECTLSGLSYGGRLWPNQDGVTHPWNHRKIFVFRTTKRGRDRFGVRGRVWVTSGPTCRASDFPVEVCPVRENIPCMDTCRNAPPFSLCNIVFSDASPAGVNVTRPRWARTVDSGDCPEVGWVIEYRKDGGPVNNVTKNGTELSHHFILSPGTTLDVRIAMTNGIFSDWQSFTTPCGELQGISLNLSTLSKRNGFARVIASWGFQPLCSVKNQTIRLKQLDRGNCSLEESGALADILQILTPDAREKPYKKLAAYSLFNVTVTVVTKDDHVSSFSGRIRTTETAPTGIPNVMEPEPPQRGGMNFKWSALECSDRNTDTIRYEYQLSSSGKVLTEKTPFNRMHLSSAIVQTGRNYAFKVRAISAKGPGPYSDVKTGTF